MRTRNRKFFAWFMVTATMLGLSFLWHKLMRDDFFAAPYNINFSPLVYLGGVVLAYAVVGYVMVSVLYYKLNNSRYDVPLISGPIVGMVTGFLAFMLMVATSTFYNEGMELKTLFLGFVWQLAEQSIGGMAWGLVASIEVENQPNLV